MEIVMSSFVVAEHNSAHFSFFQNSNFWNFFTFFWVTCFSKTIWLWEFVLAAQYWAHSILPSTSSFFLKKQNGGAQIFAKIMVSSKTIHTVGFWFTARSCMPLCARVSSSILYITIVACRLYSLLLLPFHLIFYKNPLYKYKLWTLNHSVSIYRSSRFRKKCDFPQFCVRNKKFSKKQLWKNKFDLIML